MEADVLDREVRVVLLSETQRLKTAPNVAESGITPLF